MAGDIISVKPDVIGSAAEGTVGNMLDRLKAAGQIMAGAVARNVVTIIAPEPVTVPLPTYVEMINPPQGEILRDRYAVSSEILGKDVTYHPTDKELEQGMPPTVTHEGNVVYW